MKHYKIKFDLVKTNRAQLVRNTANLLLGAAIAMRTTGISLLQTTFMGKETIYFQTTAGSYFLSTIRGELSNYDAKVIELDDKGDEIN